MITLTAEEHAAMIADCKRDIAQIVIAIQWCDKVDLANLTSDLRRQQIALESLEAEPHAWHRMPDQGFHLPMVLRKEQGPPAFDDEFYPVYTAPPVPVMQTVELPHTKCVGWVKEAIQEHDAKWIEAIRAAGGSVKE